MRALFPILMSVALSSAVCQAAEFFEGWESGAHVLFSTERRSSTGFTDVAGSGMMFGVWLPRDKDVRFGVHTVSQGGHKEELAFYRLEAGPALQWYLTKNWMLGSAVTFFRESAEVRPTQETHYRSEGHAISVGWERHFKLNPSVTVSWGGFLKSHQGNLRATIGSGLPERNTGVSQALSLGLIMTL